METWRFFFGFFFLFTIIYLIVDAEPKKISEFVRIPNSLLFPIFPFEGLKYKAKVITNLVTQLGVPTQVPNLISVLH